MQLVSLDKKRSTQLFYLFAGFLVAVMMATADQKDPAVAATGFLLAIVSVYPLYFWLLGWSHGLPIWPVFAAVSGISAALPMVQGADSLEEYSSGEAIAGAVTFLGFFVLGTVVWLLLTSRQRRPPANLLMIGREHSERYLFIFIVSGLLFYLNQLGGVIPLPGNTMQVVRGITSSLSTMGIFVLAFYDGRGLLSRAQSIWLAVLAALTALAAAAGLIMATAIVPVAMLLLGYSLGSSKVPWRSLFVIFICAAILHPGKFSMRERYWGPERPAFSLTMLPAFYSDWFSLGFQHFGSSLGLANPVSGEAEVSTLFERSGNLHMLLLVQQKSPGEVPFLDGLTYEPIPRLLLPRFIDDQKGISHAGNVLLSVNYGVQTLEGTRNTSVGWGLVPEAYANFGYLGVAALAVLLATFYSLVTQFSTGVPMTSLRFVLGLLIMSAATKADTMGVFITTQFQGMVGVSLAALFLMRRQPNPFVMGWEQTIPQLEGRADGGRRNAERQGMEHGAWSTGRGMERGAEGMEHGAEPSPAKQLAADGGVVRTMPIRTPKRIASWMPRRVRAAVVAQYAAQADGEEGEGERGLKDEETKRLKEKSGRPRQVAVPYQNYRRYRG